MLQKDHLLSICVGNEKRFLKDDDGDFSPSGERTLHGCPCTQLKRERKPSAAQQRLAFFILVLAKASFARPKRKKPPTFVDGFLTILVVGDEGFEPPTPCL
jgi:hypothetical protein